MRQAAFLMWVFVFLCFNPAFSQPANYQFSRIDIRKGLSHNQVNAIYKDTRGFLWFGTMSGLNRYDGYKFRTFRNNPADTTSISDNYIEKIVGGPGGYIWIITRNGINVFDPVTEKFDRNAVAMVRELQLPEGGVTDIIEQNKKFWFLHSTMGLFQYDPASKKGVHLAHKEGDTTTLASNDVTSVVPGTANDLWIIHRSGLIEKLETTTYKISYRSTVVSDENNNSASIYNIFMDSGKDLWIYGATEGKGIYYLDQKNGKISRFSTDHPHTTLNSNIVRGVLEDNKGKIWIATDHGGVNVLDKKDFSVQYVINSDNERSISQNTINNIYKDRSGIIWIGTYKKGISYYHENIIRFPLVKNSLLNRNSLPYDDVNGFAEDAAGNWWIGSNGGGLFYYNRSNQTYTKYTHNASVQNSLANDVIVDLYLDKQQRLWIGTYYGGLDCYDGKRFIHYRNDPANTNSIADNRIYSMLEDSQGNFWVGTLGGGLDLMNRTTGQFTHYKPGTTNSVQSLYISSLLEDADGNIWIGTAHGIDVLEKTSGRFLHYGTDPRDSSSVTNNNISVMFMDSRGWIWVGTREGLNLYNKAANRFTRITSRNGLPDNTIQGILEDDAHHIWVSTSNGLCDITIRNNNTIAPGLSFKNYDEFDGLQGKLFNSNAALKTRNGELIFGGGDGFNVFNPARIESGSFSTTVLLTDFQLFNRSVEIGELIGNQTSPETSIAEIREITLPYSSNYFSIEFAAMNFFHPEKIQYKYKLVGLNNEWLLADPRVRKATFTNLDPGTYVFNVQASNDDGLWTGQPRELTIRILPPFWKTPLAFIIYTLTIIAALLLARRLLLERERMKFSIEHERREAQRMHYLDVMKIRFFTNISHEFRTPLTLILTPIEKLIKSTSEPGAKQHLVTIHRNARRLLNLVNQLLDFRRLELAEINLSPSRGEIIGFIKEISYSFSDLSEKKNINFQFRTSVEKLETWFDHDKIEKIMFNLLSNAFKFTPGNGEVEVELDVQEVPGGEEKVMLIIRVRDTGIGIAPEKQARIFERFFQNEVPGDMMHQGSGIGLAITKEFVKLHEGTILVESEPERGSTFTVSLPVRKLLPLEVTEPGSEQDVPVNGIVHEAETLPGVIGERVIAQHELPGRSSKVMGNRPKILLVEDNDDFRFYLKDNLSQQYDIVEATNGKEGWKQLLSVLPDLVVSDISMPLMDGIELCRKIRLDPRTEHLPVILLTARSAEEQQLEGLESGANDFISKPFNFELLQSRIKNHIHQKQSLQKVYEKQIPITATDIAVENMDEKTVQKALAIVEKNISNPDFSVEDLSRELFMSRVGLYKKLVSLTGKTPLEFIRVIKLKRAAQLLEKTQLSISEVAYEVGFNNPKYFTKYFKMQFGMLPSQYQAEKKNNDTGRS